jgi:hypothetical protein
VVSLLLLHPATHEFICVAAGFEPVSATCKALPFAFTAPSKAQVQFLSHATASLMLQAATAV